jgi:hypothetical protein
MTTMPIDKVFTDRRLIAASLNPSTRRTWLTVLKAAYARKLSDEEQAIFKTVAGDRAPPTKRVREIWISVGRRGNKSEMSAAAGVYEGLFVNHKLSRGETGMVLIIAGSRDQAKTVFNYARGILDASPILRREVANVTAYEITLKNGIVIATHSSSFRTVRGRTVVAAIFDEVSFWRDETSALPDIEVYRAVMPAMATTNGVLIAISTPYRKIGLLYQKYRDHFGKDSDDILVVKGPTTLFNPTLSEDVINAQREADPTAAASEWDAEFRSDIATYLDDASIDAAIEYARPLEIPPAGRDTFYKAFTDASGGVGHDSYTLAIGHRELGEGGKYIIDVVRGSRSGVAKDPQKITEEYAVLLNEYHIREVTGDYYSAGWVENAWSKCGIRYIKSALAKSDIYLECIPLFTRGLVRLPEHPKLIRELRLLERHTHRSGRDSVDHGRSGSDDYANAVAGVLRELSNHLGYDHRNFLERDEKGNLIDDTDAWRRLNTQLYLMSGGNFRLF